MDLGKASTDDKWHLTIPWVRFQTRLKNSRKPTQPRIRFDLEKLNDPTVMSAFQATIGGRFAPLATLVDEDADLESMVTHFNKAVTDTAAELLGKQRRKRNPWVTHEILDLCDQRQDLKKKRGEPEGAKDYREIKRKIRTEMKMAKETWIQGQCQEVEACLRKNNNKKAYQLVKDLTTENRVNLQPYKTSRGSVSQRRMKSLTGGQSTAQTFTMRLMGTQ